MRLSVLVDRLVLPNERGDGIPCALGTRDSPLNATILGLARMMPTQHTALTGGDRDILRARIIVRRLL